MTEQPIESPPAIKDEEAEHPVAGAWRGPLREIVRAFVRGDYCLAEGVAGVDPVSPELAYRIYENIADYPATLIDLPDDTWESSVAQWYGEWWDVLVDLWTAEGRIDLVLECRVREADGGYRIEVHHVYVP